MRIKLKAIYERVLDCIFPPLCYSCFSHLKNNERDLSVCGPCAASIQVHSSLYCPICKSRVPINYLITKLPNYKPSCHPNAPYLLAACSDFNNPAVRELIHTFKYRKIERAIHPITELLIKPYLKHIGPISPIGPIVLVPIPLHKTKLRARGFNQSALIAQALRECLEVRPPTEVEPPHIENALVRTRKTESQAQAKSAKERLENVSGCFELISPIGPISTLSPESLVVLVDDVTTSGATMVEAVKTLKQAGAKHILAFVLAKA